MNSLEFAFGTTIAEDVRLDSGFDVATPHTPVTLQDLMEAIERSFPEEQTGMLATTAGHIADYFGVSMKDLRLDTIAHSVHDFRNHLHARKYKANSVRSYTNYYRRLIVLAMELGWVPTPSTAEIAWKDALDGIKLPAGVKNLIKYLVALDVPPSQITDLHLSAWKTSMIERGRGYEYILQVIYRLRRLISQTGITSKFPLLTPYEEADTWAIPVSQMPGPLRSEVNQILRWKQDVFAPGRPRRGRIRAITARILEGCLTRLYGYAVKELHRTDITSLRDLVCEEIVAAYLSWAINERKLVVGSLGCFFSLLAAVRHHPKYKDVDFAWLKNLLDQIPEESQSSVNERKQAKYLPHAELSTIPEKLSNLRKKEKRGTRAYARLLHDELMVRLLLTLAWRQRNIREARFGTREADNIFKEGFPSHLNIAKPRWVVDELKDNPDATFWQIYFRLHETKTVEARGVLPKQLVALLEEYINDCRPLLATKEAGNLLFVNRVGGPLLSEQVTDLIGNLTARHCGKRVTPHLFRDAFAHRYLDEHPDDYLTLSKILWHSNVQTTIKIYGRNFDESHGMKKAEEWLAEHDKANSTS